MDQTLGEYLMKLECESTNCFSWKSGAAPGANCPVQKENAAIPILNPIIGLEIPAGNFKALLRAGYAHGCLSCAV